MRETDRPLAVDDEQGRHAPHLDQLDLLPILIGDCIVRVRQADEGVCAAPPVIDEGVSFVRADHDNFSAPLDELLVVTAQLRQVPPAVRSEETAVKDQHHVLFSPESRQADGLSIDVH
jgi:hypothetical protein